ncbi:MAG: hypothetical protein V4479_02035 [Actinomycetota bacterium]
MEVKATSWWSTVSLRTKITGVTVLLVTLGLLVVMIAAAILGAWLLADGPGPHVIGGPIP